VNCVKCGRETRPPLEYVICVECRNAVKNLGMPWTLIIAMDEYIGFLDFKFEELKTLLKNAKGGGRQ